jgi:aryl-alcohol dehydrogenase-like predicted oxidoreductase
MKEKIRCIGVTESFSKDLNHKMLARAVDDNCWDVIMAGFNILNQTARKNILPRASVKGVGVLGMFAVRNALRSSKYLRKVLNQLEAQEYIDQAALEEGSFLKNVLTDTTNINIPDIAYRYCCHEPNIDSVIFGTGNLSHLQANIDSLLSPAIPEEMSAQIEHIFGDISTLSGN